MSNLMKSIPILIIPDWRDSQMTICLHLFDLFLKNIR